MAVTASLLDRVGNFAFYSRFLVIVMQGFFNLLVPDHTQDVFNPLPPHRCRVIDVVVEKSLEGLRRWDGCYFMHIAEYGYTYENTLAFFPLYPMLVRLLANSVFLPLQYMLHYSNVLLLTSTMLNMFLFIRTAKVLFTLSQKVLGDDALAFKAAQLFCINPASIFFSACYSEVSFAFLTFSGMLYCEEGSNAKASVLFALSGFTRSNGLVNSGFILYKKSSSFIHSLYTWTNPDTETQRSWLSLGRELLTTMISVIFHVTVIILPFVVYQCYAYAQYCSKDASSSDIPSHVLTYGTKMGYKMAHTGVSEWCNYTLPISYSYIQDKHWNVGFLRYFQFKQLPNFLLAAPMIFLCTCAVLSYVGHNVGNVLCLGMSREMRYKKFDGDFPDEDMGFAGFFNTRCFVYFVHVLFLLVVGVFFMHVQVVTRFIASSSPVLYWFVAMVTATDAENNQRMEAANNRRLELLHRHEENSVENGSEENGTLLTNSLQPSLSADVMDWESDGATNKALLLYFHFYYFVGVAAFANFLPWT